MSSLADIVQEAEDPFSAEERADDVSREARNAAWALSELLGVRGQLEESAGVSAPAAANNNNSNVSRVLNKEYTEVRDVISALRYRSAWRCWNLEALLSTNDRGVLGVSGVSTESSTGITGERNTDCAEGEGDDAERVTDSHWHHTCMPSDVRERVNRILLPTSITSTLTGIQQTDKFLHLPGVGQGNPNPNPPFPTKAKASANAKKMNANMNANTNVNANANVEDGHTALQLLAQLTQLEGASDFRYSFDVIRDLRRRACLDILRDPKCCYTGVNDSNGNGTSTGNGGLKLESKSCLPLGGRGGGGLTHGDPASLLAFVLGASSCGTALECRLDCSSSSASGSHSGAHSRIPAGKYDFY